MRSAEAAGKETIGHIQSAGCLGQRDVFIATHNARPGKEKLQGREESIKSGPSSWLF
jgi:hypothetical protein